MECINENSFAHSEENLSQDTLLDERYNKENLSKRINSLSLKNDEIFQWKINLTQKQEKVQNLLKFYQKNQKI